MSKKNTNAVALGGICLALTVIFLYGATFVPGIEMTLLAISSMFVAVMVLESGPKSGILLYVAASILGFLIVPNKLGLLPYVCFFGYYGVAKFYIEKIIFPIGQTLAKIALFAAVLAIGFWGTSGLIFGNIQLPDYPVNILFVCGIIFMLLYDVIYTLLIRLYKERIKREKPAEFKLSKDEENQ